MVRKLIIIGLIIAVAVGVFGVSGKSIVGYVAKRSAFEAVRHFVHLR